MKITRPCLLTEVENVLKKYVVLPSQADYAALALWIFATHCLPAFSVAPRLVIRSARKQSGKTRLLEILESLSHDARRTSNVSDAVMYRSSGGDHPKTFLIDEADTLFGKNAAANRESLRGIINSGFERGAYIPRMAGPHTKDVIEFEAFAMVALAGLGQMPETIEDRAIVIVIKPRLDHEAISYFRLADKQALGDLSRRMAEWSKAHLDALRERVADLPVNDRAADLWEPLVTIADEMGQEWPDKARTACIELTDRHRQTDNDRSTAVRLLEDIKTVFDSAGKPFLSTSELLRDLEVVDRIWDSSGLGPRHLAGYLRDFEVRARHSPDKAQRGYYQLDLLDAFERHLN